MKARSMFAVALVATFVLALAIQGAKAQSGVGVWGIPPTFSDIRVGLNGDYVEVNVTVYDQNGGLDIYNVNVLVIDGSGDEVANVTFFQHDTNTTYDVNDRFVDNAGGTLQAGRCIVDRFVGDYVKNNTIRIIFVFEQFQGKTIKVLAADNTWRTAYYEGPFSSEYRPPPIIQEEYQVYALVAVSLTASAIPAGFTLYKRVLSNRLARKIEKIERKGAEEAD
ncbi:MAG: hypothetical protein V1934_00985 [Methanobacteriota archaeon]